MKHYLQVLGIVTLRSIPMMVGTLLASTHPALAVSIGGGGALAPIDTAAKQIQAAMLGVGFTGCVIGIGLGAWHYVQHRDDWVGASGRLIAGVAGGVIVSQAVPLASLGGGVTL